MLIKVAATELKPGMYVVDLDLAPQEFPQVYPQEGLLKSAAEADSIAARGYREAFVDDSRSTVPVQAHNLWDHLLGDDSPRCPEIRGQNAGPDAARGEAPGQTPSPAVVRASLEQAVSTYTASIETVENMFSSLREEKEPPLEAMFEVADAVVDSILADNLALVTLAKLQAHDNYTFSHCVNVSVMATVFGRHLHMPDEVLRQLALGGLLHDIGKARIPLSLLNAARRLTDGEYEQMKAHALAGYEAIREAPGIPLPVKLAVLEHHERFNGTGYPHGRKAKKISIIGRMMAVVDVYDALTSKRVYKPALLPYTGVSFLFSQRGQGFDAALIDRFIQCVGVYPVGSVVQLTNGARGVVFLSNPEKPLLPVVALVADSEGRKCPLSMANLAENSALRVQGCLDPIQTGINCATVLQACALAGC